MSKFNIELSNSPNLLLSVGGMTNKNSSYDACCDKIVCHV